MTAPDRLFDELLRPIVDSYYDAAVALRAAEEERNPVRLALLARMNSLQECGDRTARVLDVAEPVWGGLRVQAGLSW